MQTDTSLTWMLILFALVIAFLNQGHLGDSPLVWGPAMLLLAPFELAMAVGNAFPLVAPLAILGLLFYKFNVLQPAVGEGMLLFIFASVLIVLLGV
ncbi:hypothetical protein HZC09_00440 [Candidatus Micrarchaeota archaeon]|nr:hypothetical protein [Candidatus Micrarchaeota archaeon]